MSRKAEILVRAVERRFGLELQSALHTILVGSAEELVRSGSVKDLASIIAKLTSAPDDDPVVRRMRQAASIGETYFFRYPRQLDLIADQLEERIVAPRRRFGGARLLRFWSAGCATGEEVYSTLALLKNRFPDFQIHAIGSDMNHVSLQVAATGVYGDRSFRAQPMVVREQWLEPAGADWSIKTELRCLVQLAQLNLVFDSLPEKLGRTARFDLILCRNVLMYIAPQKLAGVVQKIVECSSSPSILAFAPFEYEVGRFAPGYMGVGSGVFVKDLERPVESAPVDPARLDSPTPAPTPPPARIAEPRSLPPPSTLEEAKALADAGSLDAARALLTRILIQQPTSSDGWCLLGIVERAAGEPTKAIEAYRKALFLDRALLAAQLGLAELMLETGRTKEGSKHLSRAVRMLELEPPERVLPILDIPAGVLLKVALKRLEGTVA